MLQNDVKVVTTRIAMTDLIAGLIRTRAKVFEKLFREIQKTFIRSPRASQKAPATLKLLRYRLLSIHKMLLRVSSKAVMKKTRLVRRRRITSLEKPK